MGLCVTAPLVGRIDGPTGGAGRESENHMAPRSLALPPLYAFLSFLSLHLLRSFVAFDGGQFQIAVTIIFAVCSTKTVLRPLYCFTL